MRQTINIDVPTKWTDVSLKAYQNYCRAVEDLTDEDELVFQSISTLCNVPVDIVKKLRVNDIKEIYERVGKLISIPVNKEVFDRIEMGGVTYGLHPNLDELTMGEYIDLDEACKEGIYGLQGVLAILYRPIIKEAKNRYNIEVYDVKHLENARHFENISIDVVNGLMLFFYNLGSKCLMSSQTFLEELERKNQPEETLNGLPS
tara:strand:- start:212 stop:820 length:609 start_codon:yes stop_codon:yes gene_type:complete